MARIENGPTSSHQNGSTELKEKLRTELETRLGLDSRAFPIQEDIELLRHSSENLEIILEENPHLVSALNVCSLHKIINFQ